MTRIIVNIVTKDNQSKIVDWPASSAKNLLKDAANSMYCSISDLKSVKIIKEY